ncbi:MULTISPECIES: RHS repeat-associated core domain-containing protein [unclassified Pseudomonas]|uniref:RHS repeat-associated core domain-containing protein n=1 Tax=unclassified Pseudomonas TaxID=196821 RepID=UPI000BC997EE|nr:MULTISPECIES: RHS repeat-associated core domain-containing protein [unclassified Pseudomonas]PAM85452.1 type IV secretion protein Rhs [Pseudomonas sp. ERMR1:02]
MQTKYQYDALDRLVTFEATKPSSSQLFYMKDRLANRIQGSLQQTVMQHGDQALAQREQQTGSTKTSLLGSDRLGSVLNEFNAAQRRHFAYTAYGHLRPGNTLPSLLGFKGVHPDPLTGCYMLGNGYRMFSPILMRFISPDSLSPFGKGGVNAYAYCGGDPLNRTDPTGHAWFFPKGLDPIKGIKILLAGRPKNLEQRSPYFQHGPHLKTDILLLDITELREKEQPI